MFASGNQVNNNVSLIVVA